MIKSNPTNLNREARQERQDFRKFLAALALLAVDYSSLILENSSL